MKFDTILFLLLTEKCLFSNAEDYSFIFIIIKLLCIHDFLQVTSDMIMLL